MHGLGAFAVSANKETLTPGRATIIRNINYRKGKISQRQRMALLESMQILCEGIDIVQIEQIQGSEEEVRARTVSPFLNDTLGYAHHRSKRSGTFVVCDTSSKCGRSIDGGSYCMWNVVSHGHENTMSVTHLSSATWNCVPCCQEPQARARSIGLCACEEITDDKTFVQCQGDLLAETGIN